MKGLSRSKSVNPPAEKNIEPIFENVEPIMENIDPIAEEYAATVPTEIKKTDTSTAGFVTALVAHDRTTVFAALRTHMQNGGKADAFITNAVCALDDAYRARVDGTLCDPAIKKACEPCDNATLEKLIGALTTAIDSSYSTDITGAKLALTRALAI